MPTYFMLLPAFVLASAAAAVGPHRLRDDRDLNNAKIK